MPLEELQVGRYRLIRLLGSGGMGEVYLGEDTHIHRRVAVKVTRSEAMPYPNSEAVKEAVRLFQREVRAIATLDHPHILPLFDYGEENMHEVVLTYMVMPFRQEGSLATWLRERKNSDMLAPDEVLYFIRQAASALSYAHRHQIIHQDVKPSNFLIRNNEDDPEHPDLLLADFGVAKFTSASASMSQTSRGTPTYMAPEQWSGHPVAATDQYALAVMAYQLLTGHLPFQGRPEQLMYAHFNVQPQPPSILNARIPKDVDTVILHALAKKPDERFLSIAAFANAFQQALSLKSGSQALPITNVFIKSKSQSTVAPAEGDIRATITISKIEAQTGTTRRLDLPGGRQIGLPVPAGIPDGQVIRFEGQGAVASDGQPGALILTVAIAPLEETVIASRMEKDEQTYRSPSMRSAPVSAPSATPILPVSRRPDRTVRPPLRLLKRSLVILGGLILLLLITSSGIFYFKYYNLLQRNGLLGAGIANPYNNGNGSLILNDPLSNNSNGYFWDEGNGHNSVCQFRDGAYHDQISQQDSSSICVSWNSHFSNFAYEMHMRLIQGDHNGIVVYANNTVDSFYYFYISNNSTYGFDIYRNHISRAILPPTNSQLIPTDLTQSVVLAIVADHGLFSLYINNQLVDKVRDTTYSQGLIGVAVSELNRTSEAVFSNARVWTL